jgi:CRP/FNR family transcriptional regulator
MIRLYKLLPDGRRQIIGFALLPGTGGIKVTSPPTRSDRVLFASSPSPRFARSSENKPDLLRRIDELAVRELSRAQDQRGPVGEVAPADEPSGHR